MAPGLDQNALMRVCDLKHTSTLMKGIKDNNYVDVMFICKGNVKVFGQKLVLVSVSPFLKLLLSHVSCCPHNMFCVSMPDVSPAALQLVLDFLHEGVMKVLGSELQDFSDAMYVLGIELPAAATYSVVETWDLPELPLPHSQGLPTHQMGSQNEGGELVDPLNVPDYYHDTTAMPHADLPPTAPSTSDSLSSLNHNPVGGAGFDQACTVKDPHAVGRRTVGNRGFGTSLERNTMNRPRPELVVVVTPPDIDQLFCEENEDVCFVGEYREHFKNSTANINVERMFYGFGNDELVCGDAESLTAVPGEVESCNIQQKELLPKSARMKKLCLVLNKLNDLDSCAVLRSSNIVNNDSGIKLRKRSWTPIFNIRKPVRTVERLSNKQYQELEKIFRKQGNISRKQLQKLSVRLKVKIEKISRWLNNRIKKQQRDIFRSRK